MRIKNNDTDVDGEFSSSLLAGKQPKVQLPLSQHYLPSASSGGDRGKNLILNDDDEDNVMSIIVDIITGKWMRASNYIKVNSNHLRQNRSDEELSVVKMISVFYITCNAIDQFNGIGSVFTKLLERTIPSIYTNSM